MTNEQKAQKLEQLGLHASAALARNANERADFTIVSRPHYIVFACPYCDGEQELGWDKVDPPDYWSDNWGSIECPGCGKEIDLGEYSYD